MSRFFRFFLILSLVFPLLSTITLSSPQEVKMSDKIGKIENSTLLLAPITVPIIQRGVFQGTILIESFIEFHSPKDIYEEGRNLLLLRDKLISKLYALYHLFWRQADEVELKGLRPLLEETIYEFLPKEKVKFIGMTTIKFYYPKS